MKVFLNFEIDTNVAEDMAALKQLLVITSGGNVNDIPVKGAEIVKDQSKKAAAAKATTTAAPATDTAQDAGETTSSISMEDIRKKVADLTEVDPDKTKRLAIKAKLEELGLSNIAALETSVANRQPMMDFLDNYKD